jgi:hypothetical protein
MKIPDDLKVATEDDFIEFGEKQSVLIGLKFWVHTYHSNELEEHVTWEGIDMERWKPWLKDHRIYIKKDARVKKMMQSRQIDQIEIDFA